MPFRLRCGDSAESVWHSKRDEALRQGISRGWAVQGPPGCYTLADGVELEEQMPPLAYRR
jgi:hypothetical protein